MPIDSVVGKCVTARRIKKDQATGELDKFKSRHAIDGKLLEAFRVKLGLPPAQIAPFVVERIGLTQARRLGVCGGRFNGEEAERLGLVHFVEADTAAVDKRLAEVVEQIRRCAPKANAVTKRIMLGVSQANPEDLLDDAARDFAECLRSDEGTEGTMAFIEKRLPNWATPD